MRRVTINQSAGRLVKTVRLPFQGPQVLAMLALVKDVTRRPVREPLKYFGSGNRRKPENWNNPALWGICAPDGEPLTLVGADPSDTHVMPHRYGGTGDRLIGTETWRPDMLGADTAVIWYQADGHFETVTDPDTWQEVRQAWSKGRRGWRPARFMPNFASRLRREIVCVTHQRLHWFAARPIEVIEFEITREGVGWDTADRAIFDGPDDYFYTCWNGIYGELFPADEDPWVRRIEFKEIPA